MTDRDIPTKGLWRALADERPLQIVGVINAYAAMMAEQTGFRALYLSGAGVANASHGLPDLGMTTLNEVLEEVRRIVGASSLPLLVDADTGWGGALMIGRTVRELIRAGAAAMHIEDQVAAKRCGHRPGKALVPAAEMVDRIKAAVDARTDRDFVIMARTDAMAGEGVEGVIDRAGRYREAGAEMLFAEAVTNIDQYRLIAAAVGIPVLANLTEFGMTPLYSREELAAAGVAMILYPLSAWRAMNTAALKVFQTIRHDGTQAALVDSMQSRAELYRFLGYYAYEEQLDRLFGKDKP